MAYLKPDSVPARQEMEARKALVIIEKQTHEMIYKQKSYVIDSKHMIGEDSPKLAPPFDKPFPRG